MFDFKLWGKKYYLENKEMIKEKCAKYRNAHKEKYRALAKRWSKENASKRKAIFTKSITKFRVTGKGIWHVLKKNAQRRKQEFLLKQEDFSLWYRAQPKICYYCGIPEEKLSILPKRRRQKNLRFSIDRTDNDRSYELDNIVLACNLCNGVKGDTLTEEEMLFVGSTIMKEKWLKLLPKT